MDEPAILVAPDTLRIERRLACPMAQAWSLLTESEPRATWLAAGAMELVPGGRVELVFRNSELTPDDDPPPPKYAELAGEVRARGRVTACEAPRRLAHTWGETAGESEVTYDLTPDGDSTTRLVLTHRGLANRAELVSVAAGWHAHLDLLASRLAGRPPAGFWRRHTRLEEEYDRRLAL